MSQTSIDWDEDLPYDPQEEYQALVRALQRKQGFGLFFVECSLEKGNELIADLQKDLPQKIMQVLQLDRSSNTLYDRVKNLWQEQPFDILFIRGMEQTLYEYEDTKRLAGWTSKEIYSYSWKGVPRILSHLNQQRELFRDKFNCNFIFIVPSFVIKYFIQRAPDFFDWRSGLFKFPNNPDLVDQQSRLFIDSEEMNSYLELTTQQRNQKLLEVQELLKENPKTHNLKVQLLLTQSALFFTAKAYEASLTSCDEVLKLKPDLDVYNIRGFILNGLGRYEEALSCLNHALSLNPKNLAAWKEQSRTLINLKKYQEALDSCSHVLSLDPADTEAQRLQETVLKMSERHRSIETLNFLKELISNKFQDPITDLSDEEIRLLEIELAALEKSSFELSQSSSLHKTLKPETIGQVRGFILTHLKEYEKAISVYDQILDNEPKSYDVAYNKARCYALQDKATEAIDCLHRLVITNSEYQEKAKTDLAFDRIRTDDRFRAIVEGD